MILIKFLLNILFLKIGIKASGHFSKATNFTIIKYSFNFITQLTASKYICFSSCIKYDCSYVIYSYNDSCVLYNNNGFLINSPGSNTFVRKER